LRIDVMICFMMFCLYLLASTVLEIIGARPDDQVILGAIIAGITIWRSIDASRR